MKGSGASGASLTNGNNNNNASKRGSGIINVN